MTLEQKTMDNKTEEVQKNTEAQQPSKRLEPGQTKIRNGFRTLQTMGYHVVSPWNPLVVDPKAPLPGLAVGSRVDPKVRTYRLWVWVLFQTPKITIHCAKQNVLR